MAWAVCFRSGWSRIFAAPVPAALLLLLHWLRDYEKRLGIPNIDAYQAVFQSEYFEAWNYFHYIASQETLLLPPAFMVCFILLGALHGRCKRLCVYWRLALIWFFLAAAVILGFPHQEALLKHKKIIEKSASIFRREVAAQKAMQKKYFDDASTLPAVRQSTFRGTVIFVIGESTTRHHMSLYGYWRPTTPHLQKWRNDLMVHTDTISPHSFTVESLSEVLTRRDYDEPELREKPLADSLVLNLKRSGFYTWWFSAQNEFGFWENPVSLIGKQSDKSVFIRKTVGPRVIRDTYDQQLIPFLQRALNTRHQRKFIVLHAYATHQFYCDFIPPEFHHVFDRNELNNAYFGKAKHWQSNVNCYDGAVKYIDHVLDQVLSIAASRKEPTAVIYLSDHGDSPDDGTGHGVELHNSRKVEVPHIWYFNKAARKRYGGKIGNLQAHLNLPYKSSREYDSILHFVDADPTLYTANRSLFFKDYLPPTRRLTIPTGESVIEYDRLIKDGKDYVEVSQLNLKMLRQKDPVAHSKIWARRINTLASLGEVAPFFSGVELDVVYNPKLQRFDVYHPPSKPTGLTLEGYFKAARAWPNLNFWLDWKNASPDNIDMARKRLDMLDRRFNIKNRILVETGPQAVFDSLQSLAKQGYAHSYYLPTDKIGNCRKHPTSTECNALKDSIINNAKKVGANYLSFDYFAHAFMQAHKEEFAPWKLASWSMSNSSAEYDFLEKLPDTKDLSVLLVTFPTRYYY